MTASSRSHEGSAGTHGRNAIGTFHHADFPAGRLLETKGTHIISVILPARNEATTIGPIVEAIRSDLMGSDSLVDETIVIDSDSHDATARVAADAGATVLGCEDIMREFGPALGKGDVLWRSLAASKGDIIVWIDSDIIDFDTRFVTGVLGPLLCDPDVQLSKGFYERPIVDEDGTLAHTGGGRVTELTARPALALMYPELTGIIQPLSGEYAIRREAAEQLPFAVGYGVEVGLLIDIAARFGAGSIAQVDLEQRIHRNRPLDELGGTAFEVLHAVMSRAGAARQLSSSFRRVNPAAAVDELPAHVGDRPPHSSYRRG